MFKYLIVLYFSVHSIYGNVSFTKEHLYSVEELEEIALKDNKNLNVLKENVEEKKYSYYSLLTSYFPSVDYTSSATYYTDDQNSDYYTSTLSLNQLMFSPSTYYLIKEARDSYLKSNTLLEAEVNNLMYQVRIGYCSIVLKVKEEEIAKEQIKLFEDQLKIEKNKLKLGHSTQYDVAQTRVHLAQSMFNYYSALKEKSIATNTILLLLGVNPTEVSMLFVKAKDIPIFTPPLIYKKLAKLGIVNLQKSKEELTDVKDVIEGSIEDLASTFEEKGSDNLQYDAEEVEMWQNLTMKYNPTLKIAKFNLDIAKKEVSAAKSQYLPEVSGFGSYSGSGSKGYKHLDYDWSYGVTLNFNLFDSLGTHFNLKGAISNKVATEFEFEKVWNRTFLEVKDQFYKLHASLLNYFAAYESLKYAQLALKQAKERLKLSAITPLDYRETVVSYSKAKYALSIVSFELIDTYYSLLRLTGDHLVDIQEGK